MNIINRTTVLLERFGRRKKIEITPKRRFIRDWNTRDWTEIQRTPADGKLFWQYRFEITQHDLHLAFAPKSRDLPFLLIKDPRSEGYWVLWFVGWDDFTPTSPIQPQLIDRGEGFVEFRLDETTRLRFEILGHMIRKMIVVEQRPVWNRLKFRISRANAILLDGAQLGVPQKRLIAFPKDATFEDNPIFWFSEPRAWDSATGVSRYLAVNYDVQPITSAIWDLTISLDAEELDNAEYPVFVDPTVVLQPDEAEGEDTYIASDIPGGNYGTSTAMYVWADTPRKALLRFAGLDGLSAGAVNSANLKLTIRFAAGCDMSVRFARTEWSEMEATWNQPRSGYSWAEPGGKDGVDYDSSGSYVAVSGTGSYNIDVTSDVSRWLVDGQTNLGWFIVPEGTGSYNNVRSSSDANYSPVLTVDYEENGVFIPAKLGALAGKVVLSPLANA